MNDYCEDLCKEKFLNALLNMNDLDDSCLTLSTSSIISLSSLLSRKFLYHSLDQDKCFILKDDADRSLKILPKSNERPEDLECLYVDNLKDLERKCWPVNNFLNEESLKYILNFFKIRIIDKDGLFNPAQESILTTIDYIDNIVPIQIPPLSFISIEEIEKRTLAHRSMLSSAEAKRINVLSKDTLIIKDSRDLKIKLIGDFYNIRCFVNNEVEICLGDELLLYTDTPNRLVLKGSGYKEITLKINMRSSLVSWSHPLGPATDFYERNINKDFRCWWLDLFNLSDSVHISLASYPYLDVNLKNHNEIIASLPNGSMVISTGSSLEETIPWILSHKLVDPVKTRYVTSSRRPLLNIIPNKIVLHSVYFDPVKKNVYMYLINYLPKDFGVSLISSGYFKNVAVSYLKNIWESLFPSFNMLRLSLPAYSIASLRFFDEE
ncbi:MAG: hypothetical protein ACP5GI_02835 [Sulfolobales archaeon]